MKSLGELERITFGYLWTSPCPLTPAALRQQLVMLDGRELAISTVMTVLSRLERKGFVVRNRAVRPATYAPLHGREEYIAEMMHDALGRAGDRSEALARFVERTSVVEAVALKRLLGL